jgi:hypothetical protein
VLVTNPRRRYSTDDLNQIIVKKSSELILTRVEVETPSLSFEDKLPPIEPDGAFCLANSGRLVKQKRHIKAPKPFMIDPFMKRLLLEAG